MKTRLFMAALVSLSFVAGSTLAAEEELKANCPLSGKAISKDHSVAYLGKEVFFCCPNCPKAFDAENETHATKANHQLLLTSQITAVGCPLTGNKVNPDTLSKVDGAEVAFCCNNCKGKFDKADDKLALVFATLKKGFTLQTHCPVSGKKIDATKVVKHEGENVYFCCPNCPKAFESNPEKFTAKVPQLSLKKAG